ncbi:MAG: undecaprenyl-diphosphate phosphatase [Gammaproteobacteria bacterium]|nr:undecaprenyl-diphosphate phosphatase [Gammaproteobacteria bacterium]
MEFLHIVVLALIQGIGEFLPVSSSAHLILPSQLLGWPDQKLIFDVAVHIGSLIALLIYFRSDIWRLLRDGFGGLKTGHYSDEGRIAWLIVLATIPVGLMGLLFKDFIVTYLRSVVVIATTSILFGLLLWWADIRGSHKDVLAKLNWKKALLIGAAQALALIPGVSRSGSTMTMGLLLGMQREAAARFSFLLSIPVITLSALLLILDSPEPSALPWHTLLTGVLLSAISSYLCIHFFLRLISRIGMAPFAIYRLLLGVALLGMLWL